MLSLALVLLLSTLTGCTSTPPPPPPRLARLLGGMEYQLPNGLTGPLGITAGPDGAVWFSDGYDIGRITSSGSISTFPIPFHTPTPTPTPTGPSGRAVPEAASITAGPDGALWFTDLATNQIGRMTTTGVVTEFTLSSSSTAALQVITAGPDGALWFTRSHVVTNQPGGAIGRITTSGTSTEFALPTGTNPQDIIAGPDGALWFTEQDGATGAIGRITTAGSISTFPLPKGTSAWRIALGPDGALWFTDHGTDQIGRMTLSGTVREFPVPYPCSSYLWGIVAGPDQALWFTETFGPKLGRVTVAGAFTDPGEAICQGGSELAPHTDDAREIIVGPDGGLWVTELTIRAIGHFVFSSPAEHVMTTMPLCTVPHWQSGAL